MYLYLKSSDCACLNVYVLSSAAASTTMVLPPPRTTYNSDFDEDAVRQIRELSLGIKVPPSSLSLDDSVFAKVSKTLDIYIELYFIRSL